MKAFRNHPFPVALITGATSLLVGAGLVYQANLGVPPALAVLALLFLFTIGLPVVLGVACVAALWGRTDTLIGLGWFVASGVPVALLCQYTACKMVQFVAESRMRRKLGP